MTAAKVEILIYGASGHGKVIASICLAAGRTVVGFCDDHQAGKTFFGFPVRRAEEWGSDIDIVIGIGNPRVRKELHEKYSRRISAPIIHPRSHVDPSAELGRGTVVMAGAVIGPDVRIGESVIVNHQASVDHDCRLGDFSQVCPAAAIGGNVCLEEGVYLGLGASVKQGLRIGAWSTVGANGAVVKDVRPAVTVAGVPAKILRDSSYF